MASPCGRRGLDRRGEGDATTALSLVLARASAWRNLVDELPQCSNADIVDMVCQAARDGVVDDIDEHVRALKEMRDSLPSQDEIEG